MTLRVGRSTAKQLRDHRGGCLLVEGVADPDLAARALDRAASHIREMEGEDVPLGASYISPVFVSPRGPFVYIDGKDFSDDQLNSLPGVVVAELDAAGVTTARVLTPDASGPFSVRTLPAVPNLVVLMVYPEIAPGSLLHGTPVPVEWIESVVGWLSARSETDRVVARFGWNVRVDVEVGDVAELVAAAVSAETTVVVGVGEEPRRVSIVEFVGFKPALWVGVAGHEIEVDALDGVVAELQDLARSLPRVSYAAVSIDPDAQMLSGQGYRVPAVFNHDRWQPQGMQDFIDEVVPDGLHWQLMTEGHRRQMGALPSGAVELGDGRWELTVGRAAAWWPDGPWPGAVGWDRESIEPNREVRELARSLLDPLILRRGDLAYVRGRRGQAGALLGDP